MRCHPTIRVRHLTEPCWRRPVAIPDDLVSWPTGRTASLVACACNLPKTNPGSLMEITGGSNIFTVSALTAPIHSRGWSCYELFSY